MQFKYDADITYSHKPDTKKINFELQKNKNALSFKGTDKRNGKDYFTTDGKFEKDGKTKLSLTRDYRSYDLTLDNIYQPRVGTFMLKVKDRVYNVKMNREPFEKIDLKLEGNDAAYLKDVSVSTIQVVC